MVVPRFSNSICAFLKSYHFLPSSGKIGRKEEVYISRLILGLHLTISRRISGGRVEGVAFK